METAWINKYCERCGEVKRHDYIGEQIFPNKKLDLYTCLGCHTTRSINIKVSKLEKEV